MADLIKQIQNLCRATSVSNRKCPVVSPDDLLSIERVRSMEKIIRLIIANIRTFLMSEALADDMQRFLQVEEISSNNKELLYYNILEGVQRLDHLHINLWGMTLSLQSALTVIERLKDPDHLLESQTIDACTMLLLPRISTFEKQDEPYHNATTYALPCFTVKLEARYASVRRDLYESTALALSHRLQLDKTATRDQRNAVNAAVDASLGDFHVNSMSRSIYVANTFRANATAWRPFCLPTFGKNGKTTSWIYDDTVSDDVEENNRKTFSYNPNWRTMLMIFNMDNIHWVLVVFVRHGKSLERLSIVVFDSLNMWEGTEMIRNRIFDTLFALNEFGFDGIPKDGTIPLIINGFKAIKQQGGTACGLHCIDNARQVVQYMERYQANLITALEKSEEFDFSMEDFLKFMNNRAQTSGQCKGYIIAGLRNTLIYLVIYAYYLHCLNKDLNYRKRDKEDKEIESTTLVNIYIKQHDDPQILVEVETLHDEDITVAQILKNRMDLDAKDWIVIKLHNDHATEIDTADRVLSHVNPETYDPVLFLYLFPMATRDWKKQLETFYNGIEFRTTPRPGKFMLTMAVRLAPKDTIGKLATILGERSEFFHAKARDEKIELLLNNREGYLTFGESDPRIPLIFIIGTVQDPLRSIVFRFERESGVNVFIYKYVGANNSKPYDLMSQETDPPNTPLGQVIRIIENKRTLDDLDKEYRVFGVRGPISIRNDKVWKEEGKFELAPDMYLTLANYVEQERIADDMPLVLILVKRTDLSSSLPNLKVVQTVYENYGKEKRVTLAIVPVGQFV